MKVLLDTNIIIHREASSVKKDSNIGVLFFWLDKLRYEKCLHPLTRLELSKNRNKEAFLTISEKLKSYHELKTIAPVDNIVREMGANYDEDENDKNDTSLLNEVYQKRVDLFVTEDNKIHKKAETLGVADKVKKIEDFLHEAVSAHPDLADYKVLSIKQEYFGNLDINDSFFDSFKEDYNGFEVWFSRKSDEIAYVSLGDDEKIVAFLYLKPENVDENYTDITPTFTRLKRLKIGTFKVISTGYKLGERFLKIIFDNALIHGVKEIYVTIRVNSLEKEELVSLLENWGFVYHGVKNSSGGEEMVYVRDFSPHFDSDNIRHSYPFISGRCQKFIVPIYPAYHTDLLPDSILTNEQPENFLDGKAHRNAIHKVYISRSVNDDLNRGDIIIFYRTGGYYQGVITTVGLVDSIIKDIPDQDRFISLCRSRSVFSRDELLEHWNYKPNRRPFIVNFLHVHSFPKPFINLKQLIEMGIIRSINAVPRGFEPLSEKQFNLIMEKTNASHLIVD